MTINRKLADPEKPTIHNKYILSKISRRERLTYEDIFTTVSNILKGFCSDVFVSAFLMYLIINGENLDDIKATINAVRDNSIKISPISSLPIVDNCGTGGDLLNTFNISTAAAIIASSCHKVSLAKHGNRSSSSLSGSADLFEHVGFNLNNSIDLVTKSIQLYNFGFLFAPLFHPGLKNVGYVRRELGLRTIFNKIGPLCNPCTTLYGQVIGVSDSTLLELIPKIMPKLGLQHVMIVHSYDGMDELSTTGKNIVVNMSLKDNSPCIQKTILSPVDLGFPKTSINEIMVKDKMQSIRETLRIIYGINSNKSKENIVLLNSAAALVVGDTVGTFKEAVEASKNSLQQGYPQKTLENIIKNFGDISKLEDLVKEL